MSEYFGIESAWFLLNTLLEWVKVLAATYLGFRLVRAYDRRGRLGSSRRALRGRVSELEQATEELRAHVKDLLEAERFATALQLTSSGRDPAPHPRERETPCAVRIS